MSDEKKPAAAERQPDPADVPKSIDDWQATKAPPYRLLVEGFRHRLRVDGGLRKQQSQKKWEAEFEVYCFGPKGR